MQLKAAENAIRAQLRLDICAAWGMAAVFDDPPMLPAFGADLPQAYLQVKNFTPAIGQGTASMTQVSAPCVYEITGQFAWPTNGDSLEEDKMSKAQALLDILTESPNERVYLGNYRRLATNINFDDQGVAADQEPFHVVVVEFTVEVVTNI